MPNRVSHMENLVGDFGGAPEIPGDDGAIGRVPARSVCAAQKLGAFLEEEEVQGLLDGRLVASHHLQEWAPVMLVARSTGQASTGRQWTGVRERSVWDKARELWHWGLLQGDLGPSASTRKMSVCSGPTLTSHSLA